MILRQRGKIHSAYSLQNGHVNGECAKEESDDGQQKKKDRMPKAMAVEEEEKASTSRNGDCRHRHDDGRHTIGASEKDEVGGRGNGEVKKEEEHGKEADLNRFAQRSKAALRRVLPSTYARRVLPARLYQCALWAVYLFWFTVGVFVVRKTRSATATIRYVKAHSSSVSLESIERSPHFQHLLRQIERDAQPPAILMLNQHALNMTFNFLCNTKVFPGVHERFVFVTLDDTARDVLRQHWPSLRLFHWPTPSLYKPFSFADGAYQTIYLLRANLAVALIKRGKSFWCMQQDTFWRRNLFELGLERRTDFDLLFDQIGHGKDNKRAGWVNGANFFVRANNQTREFFEAVAAKLAHWYTPDMGIMIHQCHTWAAPKCEFIPHTIAHSWEWMYTEQRDAPHVIQLDCETDGGSKLQQLAKFGFYFTKPDGRTCDPEAVKRAQNVVEEGKVDVGGPVRLSWSRFQFKVYWWLTDYILHTPLVGPLLKAYLPLVGYILMFTLG